MSTKQYRNVMFLIADDWGGLAACCGKVILGHKKSPIIIDRTVRVETPAFPAGIYIVSIAYLSASLYRVTP